jgi:hypothetical protein
LVTPATQQAVERAFTANDTEGLIQYKRFLEPILSIMIEQSTDESRSKRLATYLDAAAAMENTSNQK